MIVHLLDYELKKQSPEKNHLEAFCNVISQLEGHWALAVITTDLEGILISRHGAPMVIGKGVDNISISSDVQPFYGACSEVAYMNDGDNFLLTKDGVIAIDSKDIPKFNYLEGVYDEQDPGMFTHMMMKEINDQPVSLSNVLSGRISAKGYNARLNGFTLTTDEILKLDKINLVGCGSAYYASKIMAEYIRKYSTVPVEAFRASEFPAINTCSPNTLTVGLTQSGETKDTLDALLEAKKYGSHIGSICNVIGSTISRLTGNGAYLYAGPEFAVASTKVYTNMVAVGLLFALTISNMPRKEKRNLVTELRKIPNLMTQQLMEEDGSIDKAVDLIFDKKKVLFLGRGPISSNLVEEGALKMMEVSYIPCLAYPGGELKHGPLSLIEDNTPVIAVVPSDHRLSLMESSIRECKARGAKIILITDHDGPISKLADVTIPTMKTHLALSPFVNVLPLQLLAFKVGIKNGVNVDRPRNLAKSVTVI